MQGQKVPHRIDSDLIVEGEGTSEVKGSLRVYGKLIVRDEVQGKVTEYATQLTITSDQTLEIKQTTTSGVLLVGIESTSSAQDLHDIEIHDGTPGPGTLRYFARQVSGTFRDFVPTYCKLTSNQLVLKVVNLRSDGQDLNTSLKVLHMFGG